MDYLDRLPLELKIKILTYVDTIDLIALGKTSSYWKNAAFEKEMIRYLNFYKEYRLHQGFDAFISKTINGEWVTSLNINGCYWIPVRTLIKGLKKLFMLECLYALDTKLVLSETKDLKNMTQLRRLALNTNNFKHYNLSNYENTAEYLYPPEHHLSFSVEYLPSTLTGLCLHVSAQFIEDFQKLTSLQELWIIGTETSHFYYFKSILEKVLPQMPIKIKRFVFSIPFNKTSFHIHSPETVCTFITRNKNLFQASYNASHLHPRNLLLCIKDSKWMSFVENAHSQALLPFGFKDSTKLSLNQCTEEETMFEELNFCHHKEECQQLSSIICDVLLSPNIRFLKKLSIAICLCAQFVDRTENSESLFKQPRVGVADSPLNISTFEKVVDHLPLIEELEIWKCNNVLPRSSHIRTAAFDCIKKLKHLRKFTLSGIPSYLKCEFLVDICKNCKNLSSLRVSADDLHYHLNYYLRLALPYATSLVDFRYEQQNLHIDDILTAFMKEKITTLRRIVLINIHAKRATEKTINTFLTLYKELHFLYFNLGRVSKAEVDNINHKCRLKSRGKQAGKIFVVANHLYKFEVERIIPKLIKYEMLELNSFVCFVDIYNGFR